MRLPIGTSEDAGHAADTSFYHAKHTGKPLTSASILQEVIGQAEKNLGWLLASAAELVKREQAYWSKDCRWPSGGRVGRVRRNTSNRPVRDLLTEAAVNPKTLRRACIVVSSLTRTMLKALASSKGDDLAPNQSQLAWLLATFVSACGEVGVLPVIMCPT